MIQQQLRTRIAPTPSGYLHEGNVYSFILTWLIARSQNGVVILRIDDIDAARKRPEYIEDIFYTLDWLGITYDEGPQSPADFEKHYSQHLRLDRYQQVLCQLRTDNKLFACTCSRKEIQEVSISGQYPGTCIALHNDFTLPQTAWRVFMPPTLSIKWEDKLYGETQVDLHTSMRNFVVRAKNQLPAYQLVSLVDDIDMEINCVVRGEDLIPSTGAQFYLAQLLNYEAFSSIQFYHHSIVLDADGRKLSKSSSTKHTQPLREKYSSPKPIFQACSRWLQLAEPADDLQTLQSLFKSTFQY